MILFQRRNLGLYREVGLEIFEISGSEIEQKKKTF